LIEFRSRPGGAQNLEHRRGGVSTFLKVALRRDWFAENPLTKIAPQRIRRPHDLIGPAS
jgi:hypothetical protein